MIDAGKAVAGQPVRIIDGPHKGVGGRIHCTHGFGCVVELEGGARVSFPSYPDTRVESGIAIYWLDLVPFQHDWESVLVEYYEMDSEWVCKRCGARHPVRRTRYGVKESLEEFQRGIAVGLYSVPVCK